MWAAAYGLLATATLTIVWRDRDVQMVGVMLFASWALSNLSTLFLAPVERPAFYTVLEIAVALMAYFAWLTPRSRALVAVVCVCGLSICANVALSATPYFTGHQATKHQVYWWEVFTNVCFAAECVLTLFARMRLYAGSRFDWRSLFDRDYPASHGAGAPR